MDRIDRVLLNKLAQPLPADKVKMRTEALARYKTMCAKFTAMRLDTNLSESANQVGGILLAKLVKQYMDLYKFTDEELYGDS